MSSTLKLGVIDSKWFTFTNSMNILNKNVPRHESGGLVCPLRQVSPHLHSRHQNTLPVARPHVHDAKASYHIPSKHAHPCPNPRPASTLSLPY